MSRRIKVLKGAFLVFALAIVLRAGQIQIMGDPRLARMADRQFSTKILAMPRRGHIFDRNGEGLAISLKVHSLFVRPELARKDLTRAERIHLIYDVSKALKIPVPTLAQKIASDRGFAWIKRQLSPAEEQALRDYHALDFGDAAGLVEETKRFYPNSDLASHVLGTVNVDGQGLEGLELYYDSALTGERARITSIKDAMGRKIFRDDRGLLAYRDGQSLVLTIDKAIQYEAEKALRLAIEEHQARAGTVIVAEVSTGEILAMANNPTFNPNNPKTAMPDRRRNRAITDTYEPGSTFKPFLVGYALEHGKSPKHKVFGEHGHFRIGKYTISEAEAREKYEWLTLGEILKYSSNVGAAKLALELGPASVAELMDRLGIGRKTDIDLPGEAPGSFDAKGLSTQIRLANTGFGHGFTVTPLQIMSYYLMLANGGRWVQPKLVRAVLSEDPDSLERGAIRYRLGQRLDAVRSRRVFPAEVAHQLTAMLETVVEEKGTGVQAQLAEWPVAGKTGTAQKVDPETHRYSRTKHITSFAGYAPAKDPKLVALVVLDEPQKGLYAAETAAPAFREVMRASLLREQVTPLDNPARIQEMANSASVDALASKVSGAAKAPKSSSGARASDAEESPAGSASPSARSDQAGQSNTASLSGQSGQPTPAGPITRPERNDKAQIRLPDLRGLTIREALRAVADENLDVEVSGTGVLREQLPPHDRWLAPGSRVQLIFKDEARAD